MSDLGAVGPTVPWAWLSSPQTDAYIDVIATAECFAREREDADARLQRLLEQPMSHLAGGLGALGVIFYWLGRSDVSAAVTERLDAAASNPAVSDAERAAYGAVGDAAFVHPDPDRAAASAGTLGATGVSPEQQWDVLRTLLHVAAAGIAAGDVRFEWTAP